MHLHIGQSSAPEKVTGLVVIVVEVTQTVHLAETGDNGTAGRAIRRFTCPPSQHYVVFSLCIQIYWGISSRGFCPTFTGN